jgi:hypothetical protein
MWKGAGLPDFDAVNPQHVAHEAEMNELQRSLMSRSSPCHA